MKSLIAASFLSFAMVMPALAAPRLGSEAPDFEAVSTNGEAVKLSDIDGVVVLEWTNDGCPFVKKHYESGNMQATQKTLTEGGAKWITIISSAPGKQGYVDAEEANSIAAEHGAMPDYTILDPTGDIGKLYKAQTTPHMFVIEDGILEYAGAIDSIPSGNPADIERAENYVLSAFADIQAGNEVQTASSKPYGCNVKY
ncbi:redoxin domain-containing protein [Hirschia baltica]|uniref:Alkyl hydroperoxide reductase/ Thiol specific antioxidant/ Mal allergen n=1 Tax=Hirschia baltica (strain ATCC 49814 / DSM 5838 / IFAM 1418) TaxID=582402 RepID=C6XKY4_HIRBI|nr:redoxin domain-containing protein [Hirschia baltica]ACT57813.1 alkyl hydroperoxide reductase/ Thiol specific antioxidant/ Mal allergen [Hirschia baltica ATCC 49814]